MDGSRRALIVMRWPVGGIRTYIRYNYPALQEAGWRFTFIGPEDESFRAFAEEWRALDGAEFVPAALRGKRCRLAQTVRDQLRMGQYALVHSHGLTAAAQAAWANRRIGMPHLATAHDVFRPTQVRGVRGWAKLRLLGRLLRRLNRIIACGEDVRSNLLEYLPGIERHGCRLLTIRNGIDTNRFAKASATADDLRRQLELPANVRLFGFLGRFMEQKGFLPLLDALDRLRSRETAWPFHLVAVGSGDYEREYRAEVQRRGLSQTVSFLGFIAEVGPVLRQLDVLLMPSLWEACPLLPMEAMAAGVPVLGSDCIGLREVLRDTPSRMARAGDSAAWCDALHQAMDQPWTAAAQAFADEARRRFDVAAPAQRLLEVFEEEAMPATAVGRTANHWSSVGSR
jgi:glycosyltransferase involved in cell wall biosynthesis